MRRGPLIVALASSLMLAGCGKSLTTSDGTTHGTYGFLNASSRDPGLCYEVSAGNVIWSVILIESIVFPVYFVGFSLFNPVRAKRGPTDACEAL